MGRGEARWCLVMMPTVWISRPGWPQSSSSTPPTSWPTSLSTLAHCGSTPDQWWLSRPALSSDHGEARPVKPSTADQQLSQHFRSKFSAFTAKLSQSQAVEFYGEWLLVPSNLTFQRVHTGLLDPTVIGDKFKVKPTLYWAGRVLTVTCSVVCSPPGARVFLRLGQSQFSQHRSPLPPGDGGCGD